MGAHCGHCGNRFTAKVDPAKRESQLWCKCGRSYCSIFKDGHVQVGGPNTKLVELEPHEVAA